MSKALDKAKNIFLDNKGLGVNDVENTLGRVMSPSIDQADLYFQSTHAESWVLEDQIVREGSHSINQGVGIRAISGEKTGFAYSDEIILPALTQAATAARSIAKQGKSGEQKILASANSPVLYTDKDPLNSIPTENKVDFLKKLDEEARKNLEESAANLEEF